jgi:WD40 repeat protein
MSGYMRKVRELAWSADSRLLATGGVNDVIVWNCAGPGPEGRPPLLLKHHREPISQLGFQNDGSVLASGCDEGLLAFWRPRSGKLPIASGRLDGGVTRLAWSNDGTCIAASTANGVVSVFRTPAQDRTA